MKKIFKICLLIFVMFAVMACGKDKVLTTPRNVQLSSEGLLSWDVVPNATSYTVKINDEEITVITPFHLINDLTKDFTYTVTAHADGYQSSPASEQLVYQAPKPVVPEQPKKDIKIGISGSSEVKPGKTITLTANVTVTALVVVLAISTITSS